MYFSTVDKVQVNMPCDQLQHNNQNITSIKHIIAISSGRDRVGKNTIAVNIAINLAQIGSKVGLLDADPNNLKASQILGLKDSHVKVSIRGGEKSTPKIRVPYLGYIPLDPAVPKYRDRGLPIALAEPSSIFASALNTIIWAISSRKTIAALKS